MTPMKIRIVRGMSRRLREILRAGSRVRPDGTAARPVTRPGTAAVEFALVSVPMLMLLFGFVATNAVFLTLTSMQNNVQNATVMMATGQITSFQSKAVTCGSGLTATQAEYYACQNLPSWATFTVTATESCTAPATVTVKLTVNASAAGLVDTYGFYTGKTLQAQATNMKQGTCP